jgi:flagellar hook assembly protein FlgD
LQSINGYITFKNLTENVTLQIYNMAGEKVQTIQKISGGDEVIWDARNSEGEEVASGTYVCVIQSAEDTFVGKVVILR